MRRRTFLLSSAGFVTAAAGCSSGDTSAGTASPAQDRQEEATVVITGDGFDPLVVELAVGGTVTWENSTDEEWSLDATQFKSNSTFWSHSASIPAGESVSHTFEETGIYDYTNFDKSKYDVCGSVRVGDHGEVSGGLPCE